MRIRIIIILVFTHLQFFGSAQDFYPEPVAEKAILKTLKEKVVYISEKRMLPNTDSENTLRLLYKLKRNNDEAEYYAVFCQAKGRYEWFDYLVIINSDLIVEEVKVLKYRSEYGGEIASKKWLEQFKNYSVGNLEYGKDISALSGATISANALVKDIPKVLKTLKENCE